MLRLFRPQILGLLSERDAKVQEWQTRNPCVDVFEDHDADIASSRRISDTAQIKRVETVRN